MKTIEFTANDGYDYVIPTTSVTFLSPNINRGVTWVSLNNGIKLLARIQIKL